MADLSNYFTFPGTGNWGSGSTQTGSAGSTTTKYFNPQAILDQLNAYRQRTAGTYGLNNSILYGKKPPTYATGAPYAAPPTPLQQPAGQPAAAPPAVATKPPVTTTPPTGTQELPSAPGHGPYQPNIPTPAASHYGEVPVSAMQSVYNNSPESGGAGGPVAQPGPGIGGAQARVGHTPVTGNPGGIVLGGAPIQHTREVPTGDPTVTMPPGQAGGGGLPTAEPLPGGQDAPGDTGSEDGLLSALQQLLSGTGYSDAEKQAIREQGAQSLAAQKASAQAQMASHLASSGNAAGYGGAMSALDTGAARTAADQARQNEIDFSNEGERRKELASSALGQLLGINTAADLGYMGQGSGLAALGGGQDTANKGATSFENKGFQATPDASAKPGTWTSAGGKNPDGTMAGSKPYIDPSTGKPYVWDPKLGWQALPTAAPLTPEQIAGINNGTMYIDPTTGEIFQVPVATPLPGGEVPPEQVPGQYTPPPELPPGFGNQDPTQGAEPSLPDPTGGDPGTGIEGDPSDPITYTLPQGASRYFSPGAASGAQQITPQMIARVRRMLELS